MTEYIEREALFKAFERTCWFNNADRDEIAEELLLQMPTADVVEVVRCKDCAIPHNKWLGCPNLNGLIPPPDFYCAKGKRKEDKHAT